MLLELENLPQRSAPTTNGWRIVLVTAESWCAPCIAQAPLIASSLEESGLGGSVTILDEQDPEAIKYRVSSVPTWIILDEQNRERRRQAGGFTTRQQVDQFIASWLGNPKQAPAAPMGFRAGTLKGARENIRKLISVMRPLLEQGGSIKMITSKLDLSLAGAGVTVPKDCEMAWSMKDDRLKIGFNKPLGLKAKGLNLSIRSVTIDEERVNIDLPWFPDAELQVVD